MQRIKLMRAIILAGGYGTRLYPLTWGRPKSLAPLANLPFIDRMLSWLSRHDLREAVIALNHFPEMIRDYVGDGDRWGLRIDYLLEAIPLGSGGAIKNAQKLLAGEETFLVVNGDILTDLNLKQMLAFHRNNASQITISLTQVADPSHFGVVDQTSAGRLRRFVEKPSPDAAPSNFINAGAWLFQAEVLDQMPPQGEPFSLEREFWPQFLAKGGPMFGYFEDCYWLDIGTIERYLQANQDIMAGRIRPILGEKQVSPGIWLGAGAAVSGEATLTPPVVIGPGVKVGAKAAISRSVIGSETIIEANASIADSVLWENIRVESGAKIVRSVIGGKQVIARATLWENSAIQDFGASAPK
jgi:mannose-1-phosphate guanylyltransferase